MTNADLGPGSEFDAIRNLVARWGDAAAGIGDDAAILLLPRGDRMVVSVDAAVEGRHFRRDWLSPREIGYRAVSAALSDLAAMAAHPMGVLVSFALPTAWRDQLLEIADGVGEAVIQAKTKIRGGNLTAAAELSITTTVLGTAFSPLSRSGAHIGDRVYVTGRLGGPRSAIAALSRGEATPPFRDRFAHPVPRLAEARWLAERGATSAIDISDGLVADLGHVAAASGVSIELDPATIPCLPQISVEDALQSGEEYELAISIPHALDAREFERRFHLDLTEIGRVIPSAPSGVLVPGVEVAALRGHDHFSG